MSYFLKKKMLGQKLSRFINAFVQLIIHLFKMLLNLEAENKRVEPEVGVYAVDDHFKKQKYQHDHSSHIEKEDFTEKNNVNNNLLRKLDLLGQQINTNSEMLKRQNKQLERVEEMLDKVHQYSKSHQIDRLEQMLGLMMTHVTTLGKKPSRRIFYSTQSTNGSCRRYEWKE